MRRVVLRIADVGSPVLRLTGAGGWASGREGPNRKPRTLRKGQLNRHTGCHTCSQPRRRHCEELKPTGSAELFFAMVRPIWLAFVFLAVGSLLLLSGSQNLNTDAPIRRAAAPTALGDLVAAGVPFPEQPPPLEQPPIIEKQTTAVTATAALLAQTVRSRPRHACTPGCEANGGVCNAELGRCDCPPFIGGDACDQPLFAACGSAVGLKALAPAPCLIETMGGSAPASCECLMGCEALGLMGRRECYVMDPENETTKRWVNHQIHMRGLAPNYEYWEKTLKPAEALSVAECSGHGVYAPRMPPSGAGHGRKSCMCYPGWVGSKCEVLMVLRGRTDCLNGCSARGKCLRNWCQCDKGYFGVDCSMGNGPIGGASVPLPPPIGAQEMSMAPKLYVYELPPRFNSWMHAGEVGWWQDMDLWGEDVVIHRRALRSTYRVLDPEQADYFLVPVWDSSAMWQMNWGFRDLLPTGVRAHADAVDYIRATWPYFDRKGGKDHLWVFGHDQGGWRIRQKLPVVAEGVFISPFGGGPAQRGGHRAGHDIVCPSVLYAHVPTGLMNHAHRRKVSPPNLAFFQGKLNLHIPYEYSFGIRQGLYKAHRTTPRIVIKEGHEANKEVYFENMGGSKFCVAAAGFGFSTRAYESAASGCVPLIMQDGIEQAYEDLLPWSLFSLRLNNSLAQIANLSKILETIPESQVRWIALDCFGLRRSASDCVGLRWIALDCVGLRRIARVRVPP